MMHIFINFLTISRIFSGPLIFALIIVHNFFLLSLIIAIFASLTDFFDGYLARKYSEVSEFGRIFDPIADKVMIVFCLIAISIYLDNILVGFCTASILSREIIVSGLREFASQSDRSFLLNVTFLAKIKTSFQLFSIICYLIGFSANDALIIFISHWALFLATLITIKTGLDYYLALRRGC